jgi:hypothetical protein
MVIPSINSIPVSKGTTRNAIITKRGINTIPVAGGFPFAGTWANLMDNSTFSVMVLVLDMRILQLCQQVLETVLLLTELI